jgi:hypothetical protein
VYEARGEVAKALEHLQLYRSQMRESVDTNEIDEIINALETKNPPSGVNKN